MLVLRGAPALSDYRQQKLSRLLQSRLDRQVQVYGEFTHFAALDQALSQRDERVLERLLRYGPSLPIHEPSGTFLLVVPRLGTQSPWSTKATDIARRCGLEGVERIERGMACWISGLRDASREARTSASARPPSRAETARRARYRNW